MGFPEGAGGWFAFGHFVFLSLEGMLFAISLLVEVAAD